MTPKTIFSSAPATVLRTGGPRQIPVDEIRFELCEVCGTTLILHPSLVRSGDVHDIINHHARWHATQKKIFRRVLNYIREN